MTNEIPLRPALTKLGNMASVGHLNTDKLLEVAELEVRLEQVRQQELTNWIAMAANPALFPFPRGVAAAKIQSLVGVELIDNPEILA